MDKTQTKNTIKEIAAVLSVFTLVIAVGVFFYHYHEDLRWIDAIYYTTVTLTTVGYGDFVPQTDLGKLFTSVYAFLGIGMFLGTAGVIFRHALDYSRNRAGRPRIKNTQK